MQFIKLFKKQIHQQFGHSMHDSEQAHSRNLIHGTNSHQLNSKGTLALYMYVIATE